MVGFASFESAAEYTDDELTELQKRVDPESKCELGNTIVMFSSLTNRSLLST